MKVRLLVFLFISMHLGCKDESKTQQNSGESVGKIVIKESNKNTKIDSTITDKNKTEEIKKGDSGISPQTTSIIAPTPLASDISVIPIEHATMILQTENIAIYVDPVGGKERFAAYHPPTFILITDIHSDHFNIETIASIINDKTIIIGPRAVKEKLPAELLKSFTVIFNGLGRGFKTSKYSLDVQGVAMYNLREDAKKYHPKGRGNGYVVTLKNKRIYISGDTEDIFEMRQLKDIDFAFICMNLPYTMSVESAADAVLDFKPAKVFPYHYKGSDVEKFRTLVNNVNPDVKVVQLKWYPHSS